MTVVGHHMKKYLSTNARKRPPIICQSWFSLYETAEIVGKTEVFSVSMFTEFTFDEERKDSTLDF